MSILAIVNDDSDHYLHTSRAFALKRVPALILVLHSESMKSCFRDVFGERALSIRFNLNPFLIESNKVMSDIFQETISIW